MYKSDIFKTRLYVLILATALILIAYWNILSPPNASLEFEVNNPMQLGFLERPSFYLFILTAALVPALISGIIWNRSYIKKWYFAILASLIASILFIPWDILFSHLSVWSFNERYVQGIWLFQLPLEEWLFFLLIPFCCILILDTLLIRGRSAIPYRAVNMYTSFAIVICVLLLVVYPKQWYTSSVAIMGMCLASGLRATVPKYRLIIYYHAFFWSLIPFLIIDGLLTGSFTSEPVVLYNASQITGHRLFTIPIEDAIYCYGLLMISFVAYDRMRN